MGAGVFHSMENFFAIFPHNGKNVGLRATFGPRSESELALRAIRARDARSTLWKNWKGRGHEDFQESLRVTVRLKRGAPGWLSGSAVK